MTHVRYGMTLERLSAGKFKWALSIEADDLAAFESARNVTLPELQAHMHATYTHTPADDCPETCPMRTGIDTAELAKAHTRAPTPIPPQRIELTERVLDALEAVGEPMMHQTIADSLGEDYFAVRTALHTLMGTNRIARTGSGGRKGYLYALLPRPACSKHIGLVEGCTACAASRTQGAM